MAGLPDFVRKAERGILPYNGSLSRWIVHVILKFIMTERKEGPILKEKSRGDLTMDKTNVILHERITIGISACTMGSPVRYNAKGWDLTAGLGREKSDFKWVPVCPETMSGLGVPRDPIHLSGGTGKEVWSGLAIIKNRGGQDVTEDVKFGTLSCLETLERAKATAFIYMDGSPTCGVYRTSLKKQKRGNPPGIFGTLLLDREYFLIPASDLQSPIRWWDWRRRLLAFHWFRSLPLESKNSLYEAWYKLKFLCQELDEPWAREMGRRLADLGKQVTAEDIAAIRGEILEVLRRPSTTAKITQMLWKNYSFYRKAKGKTVDGINSPDFRRNVTTIAKELTLMERTAFEEGVFFASSPVLYREKRRMPKPVLPTTESPAEEGAEENQSPEEQA